MKNSYHHGNLKSALIQAGVKLLAESGVGNLSLRKLAREVGVSHNAPYMHFADKEAVLAAIAEQGFQLLSDAIDAGQQQVSGQSIEVRLNTAAWSYVSFALEYPSHLKVMFGKLESSAYPDLMDAARSTFQKLVQIMQAGKQSKALKAYPAEQIALLLWMNVHGLSELLIAQKIPTDARRILSNQELVERSVQMLCSGILN